MLAFDVDPNGLPIRNEGATYLEDPTGAGTSVELPYPTTAGGLFAARATYIVDAWFEVANVRPKGAPVASPVRPFFRFVAGPGPDLPACVVDQKLADGASR